MGITYDAVICGKCNFILAVIFKGSNGLLSLNSALLCFGCQAQKVGLNHRQAL
uniref:Uncharacterized protein n=1 Tax=Anguilla anguilla TaxID=7936 RepID=A0A0E9TGW4_ANGAN